MLEEILEITLSRLLNIYLSANAAIVQIWHLWQTLLIDSSMLPC